MGFSIVLGNDSSLEVKNIEILAYSSVPNRRACTFINFEKKIPPALSYFGLHNY